MERIAAREERPLTVHLVDDEAPGAGRIWRTDQDRDMCMNTLAGAVTLYTDASFSGAGPVREGPSLHEWCQLVAEFAGGERADVGSPRRSLFESGADLDEVLADDGVRSEVFSVGPGSHPSRALYGYYCRWVLRTALALLGPSVAVTTHRTRATAIRPHGAGQSVVELANATSLVADSVALSPGWLPSEPNRADVELEERIRGRAVVWIRPDSPIQQDLTAIQAGENIVVRGLGMGFFDSLSMLSIGRDGHFEDIGDNRLRYLASGREPAIHVGSRRGLPFLAKSVYHGLPPAPRLARLRAAERRGLSSPLRFTIEIWPHLVRDACEAYYRVLARTIPLDLASVLSTIDVGDHHSLPQRLQPLLPDGQQAFDLQGLFRHRVAASGTAQYNRTVRDLVAADLSEADRGLESPLKAALWEVNGARRWLTERASFDGITAEDYNGDLAEFLSFGGMIGSGPPAFRARQLLALLDAGVVHFIGPDVVVDFDQDDEVFTTHSPLIAGSGVSGRVLLDAWVRLHDARRTRDPLVRQLMEDGLAEPFARRNAAGGRTPGSSLRIDRDTSELIGPAGRHGIHLLGVPSDEARGDTIIAPMPGTDPTMLREVDACVEAMLTARTTAQSTA